MAERKAEKLRKCASCKSEILTTAKGIQQHAAECVKEKA